MHAYIVTGSSSDEWIQKMLTERSVSSHDTITLQPDPASIGVESIRSVTGQLSLHPIAGIRRAVVIRGAHTMTIEAQNAFLKTLEEPPGDALIILVTDQPDSLLPTVLSRCHLVRLKDKVKRSDEAILQCIDTLKFFSQASIGERLKKIDEIVKTRDDAQVFTDLAIVALHRDLAKNHRHATLLRALMTARQQILGNVTPKLALDAVFWVQ